MKKTKKEKEPMEFSKKILIVVSIFCSIVTFFTMYMVWKTGDTSSLGYLIVAIFAELAVGTGYYYNKAKAENLIKLQQEYKKLGINLDADEFE